MVLEIAQFTARPGKAGELRDGLLRGLGVIRGASGCRSATLRHCVEEPDRFIYEIEWETLNDHIVTFRGGPLFAEYRAQINSLYTEPVMVHHYERVEG